MRIYNLPRGGGKSIRMVFASDFNKAPILCVNQCSKRSLIEIANSFNLNIPEPITIFEYIGKYHHMKGYDVKEILVDEPLAVLQAFLQNDGINMIGCALSDEKNERKGGQN